jgi:2-octaprenyl-6-methoxyphenol hydroxylase
VAVGNAAQTLHPVAGQGFNLALRDCATLVDCIVASRADVPGALAGYARQRRIDRSTIARVTHWLPQVFATRFAPVAIARSLGLTALDLVPPLRNELAHLLMFGVR